MAEMERFELSHGVTRLPHFECGPFNHLGTSPLPKHYATEFPGLQEETFRSPTDIEFLLRPTKNLF